MKFAYRILSLAANEILEAAVWYDDQRDGLGDELILNFEASLNTILRNPFAYQLRFKDLRLVNISRFPFQIIYYVEKNLVTVIAFHHSKKSTRHWSRRKKK